MTEALFSHNLRALGLIYPGLAKAVQACSPATINTAKKDTLLQVDPKAELHVLFRFNGIKQVNALLKCVQDLELRGELNRRVLLIEDRLPQFRFLLEHEDWRGVIQSDHCLLLVSNEMASTLPTFLSRYGEVACCQKAFYWGDKETPQNTRESLISLFDETQQRERQTCLYAQKESEIQRPPFSKNIRFVAAGHNYLQEACVAAFHRLGYGAARMAWQSPIYRFVRSSAWLNRMAHENADTAFFVNSTPTTFSRNALPKTFSFHTLVWFVDNPRRYVQKEEELRHCDLVGVFDKTYLPYLQTKTEAPVVEVRTGYGISRSVNKPIGEKENLQITFVGELGTRGFLNLEKRLCEIDRDQLERLNRLVHEIDLSQSRDYRSIVEEERGEIGRDDQGAWVDFFENKATMLRRRYYLDAIADRGLQIFGGEEWSQPEWAGVLTDCYMGKRLDYFRELPNVYAASTININIFHTQCVAAPNPRVYDVLACGGFLLTSYNPGLEDEFEIGVDFDVFESREELGEKVDYYQAHPALREQMAQSGQQRVLARCSYDDRMQIFLNILSSKTRNNYVYIC